jgi:hypothetical protein
MHVYQENARIEEVQLGSPFWNDAMKWIIVEKQQRRNPMKAKHTVPVSSNRRNSNSVLLRNDGNCGTLQKSHLPDANDLKFQIVPSKHYRFVMVVSTGIEIFHNFRIKTYSLDDH